jgi:hypothetical protein
VRILIAGNMGCVGPVLTRFLRERWFASRRTAASSSRVNARRNESNYQVRDLAEAVARQVLGTNGSINRNAPPDKRSYKVDFSLFKSVAPDHIPQVTLDESIRRLGEGLTAMGFADKDFPNPSYMRLKTLERHMAAGRSAPTCGGVLSRA